jgi:tetratricopeptide (TPR) repeat protein
MSIGLPGGMRAIRMPVVGLGYAVSILATIGLLLRAGNWRTIAPATLVMLTQAVWFSIPHIGFYLDWTTGIPALNPVGGDRFRFYFLWTAVGHAAQYLWITAYYAKANRRWGGYGKYFAKTFVFGNAVWAAPVLILGPESFGKPDFESGLAMCVASAVNLHHFVLDGAIWKLRNPKIANVLLRSHADRSSADNPTRAGPWKNRAAYYGRDSSGGRARLANGHVKTQDPWRSIPQYWRSLKFQPQADGFLQLGLLSLKLEGREEALRTWSRGLEEFPDDFGLNERLGVTPLRAQRNSEAIPYLERALEIRPDHPATIRSLKSAHALRSE